MESFGKRPSAHARIEAKLTRLARSDGFGIATALCCQRYQQNAAQAAASDRSAAVSINALLDHDDAGLLVHMVDGDGRGDHNTATLLLKPALRGRDPFGRPALELTNVFPSHVNRRPISPGV